MIEIIILTILCLIVLFFGYEAWHGRFTVGEFFGASVGACFFTAAISIFIAMLIGLGFECFHSNALEPVETGRTNCRGDIYSIRNQETTSGRFFLGSGNISSREQYYFFQKTERGAYTRSHIYSSDVDLFQDEDNHPYLAWQIIHYRPSKWVVVWTFGPFQCDDVNTRYDIHVPKDTIVEEYRIN